MGLSPSLMKPCLPCHPETPMAGALASHWRSARSLGPWGLPRCARTVHLREEVQPAVLLRFGSFRLFLDCVGRLGPGPNDGVSKTRLKIDMSVCRFFSVTSWQKIIKAEYRYVEPAACFDELCEPLWRDAPLRVIDMVTCNRPDLARTADDCKLLV